MSRITDPQTTRSASSHRGSRWMIRVVVLHRGRRRSCWCAPAFLEWPRRLRLAPCCSILLGMFPTKQVSDPRFLSMIVVVSRMIIRVIRPRVYGPPDQRLMVHRMYLIKPVLFSRRAKTIVFQIPTMTMGIGNRAHQTVRDGQSTLPGRLRYTLTMAMVMLPHTLRQQSLWVPLQPVAQDAQHFQKMCLPNWRHTTVPNFVDSSVYLVYRPQTHTINVYDSIFLPTCGTQCTAICLHGCDGLDKTKGMIFLNSFLL